MEPILMPGGVTGIRTEGRAAAGSPEAQPLREAATELEGVFLGLLLKAMRGSPASGGLFHEGSDTQMYREMFDQEIGRSLSRAGGIGLAEMILRDQARRQETGGAASSNDQGPSPFGK
ncbi:MAG TPA: rod-binding protein [Candidatus Methylomirabilis sp.]|nr:rod-binding protein [Candidatus Methylomirabilis sp.]